MSTLNKAIELAFKQHGVFSIAQLKSIGIGANTAKFVVKNKIFIRQGRGVYKLSNSDDTWHSQALVSVLGYGKNARLSHESALMNLGLLPEDFVSKRKGSIVMFHITKPRVAKGRLDLHRTVYDEPLSAHEVNAIPQVSTEHALIESARYLPPSFLSSAIDLAIRKNYVTTRSMQTSLDKLWPGPGRSKLRIIELLMCYSSSKDEIAKSESILESKVLRVISQLKGVNYKTQFPVRVNGRAYRVDIAVPDRMLAIEVDGFAFHRSRDQFDADRIRQNDLVVAGWKVVRITNAQNRDQIKKTISDALRS